MAKILKFPDRNDPREEDIVILMRAAIQHHYEKVSRESAIRNVGSQAIIAPVRK